MELEETTPEKYHELFPNPYHIFNTAAFNRLNEAKCESVHYLLFKDTKYKLGIVFGVRNNKLLSPFSAPFAGFSFKDEAVQLSAIESAVTLTEQFAVERGLSHIRIQIPPLFYAETFLSKYMNVLYRNGYETEDLDLDFYIDLNKFSNYDQYIWYNAKKNLTQAKRNNLEFRVADPSQLHEIYAIISANRQFRNKPLNMSIDDIARTKNVIPTDLFLVYSDGTAVASAIVYHVTNSCLYIPFWADLPGNNHLRAMNFLSAEIIAYYKQLQKHCIHIGISTEHSIPNYGLCEFKESIGSTLTPKYTFQKKLS